MDTAPTVPEIMDAHCTASASLGKIAAALSKAQAVMHHATKDSNNPFFSKPGAPSKYADLASVIDACRAALAANEIAVVQPVSADGAKVTVTTLLIHSSGEWLGAALTMTAKESSPQAVGSAITYGRRYGLAAMVCVGADDDDGEAAHGRTFVKRETSKHESVNEDPAAELIVRMRSATDATSLRAIAKTWTGPENKRLRAMFDECMLKFQASPPGDHFAAVDGRAPTPAPYRPTSGAEDDGPPTNAGDDALTVEVRDLIKLFGTVKAKPQMAKLVARWTALPHEEQQAMLPYVQDAAKRIGYEWPKAPDHTDDLPKGF